MMLRRGEVVTAPDRARLRELLEAECRCTPYEGACGRCHCLMDEVDEHLSGLLSEWGEAREALQEIAGCTLSESPRMLSVARAALARIEGEK